MCPRRRGHGPPYRRPVVCTVLYSRPMQPDEKRESDRVAMLGDLQGEIMMFEPMRVTEISLEGATVETRAPLHLNSLHGMRLTLGERSVVVKGRVVHSRISDVDQDLVT